jgi:hypothetical protein
MSRIPYFLDKCLTDGGKVFSLMSRLHFTTRKIFPVLTCYRMSKPQGHGAVGRIRELEKIQWPYWESNPPPSGF